MTDDDKALVERCNICKRPLNNPNDPTSRDCGGDCLRCMAVVAEDPDCMKAYIEALITESEMLREALDKLTEASSKMLTEAISRGNALDALEAENARLRGKLVAISNMYPDWASERMALVRKRAREALGDA